MRTSKTRLKEKRIEKLKLNYKDKERLKKQIRLKCNLMLISFTPNSKDSLEASIISIWLKLTVKSRSRDWRKRKIQEDKKGTWKSWKMKWEIYMKKHWGRSSLEIVKKMKSKVITNLKTQWKAIFHQGDKAWEKDHLCIISHKISIRLKNQISSIKKKTRVWRRQK